MRMQRALYAHSFSLRQNHCFDFTKASYISSPISFSHFDFHGDFKTSENLVNDLYLTHSLSDSGNFCFNFYMSCYFKHIFIFHQVSFFNLLNIFFMSFQFIYSLFFTFLVHKFLNFIFTTFKIFLIDTSTEIINDFVRFAAFTAFVITSFVHYFNPKQLLLVFAFDGVCLQISYFLSEFREVLIF